MIRQTAESLADLYEADETAWLDAMAELIRTGQFDAVDFPHLAEYLEDMAKRDRREVNSRLRELLVHVLKWIYQQNMRTGGWKASVLVQQHELEDLLESGVLQNHAVASLAAIYAKAVKEAVAQTGLPTETFPAECPWTLEQLMSPEVLE